MEYVKLEGTCSCLWLPSFVSLQLSSWLITALSYLCMHNTCSPALCPHVYSLTSSGASFVATQSETSPTTATLPLHFSCRECINVLVVCDSLISPTCLSSHVLHLWHLIWEEQKWLKKWPVSNYISTYVCYFPLWIQNSFRINWRGLSLVFGPVCC